MKASPSKSRRVAALVLGWLLLSASPAFAADPYDADPLRLVPFADTVQHVYADGADLWDVWLCRTLDTAAGVPLDDAVADLNNIVGTYFQAISAGRYVPLFSRGGIVASNDDLPDEPGPEARVAGCEAAVAAATSGGTAEGALIIVDAVWDGGYGTMGRICPDPALGTCPATYPGNGRIAVVGGAAVSGFPPSNQPRFATVVHEMGHALAWPHSFGGLTTLADGMTVNEYDNPMDVMSGGTDPGTLLGPIAFDRYMAGWIDVDDVVFHRGGVAEHILSATIEAARHLLVIPLEPGRFYALNARIDSMWDAALPATGVELYEVDQRRERCNLPPTWPTDWPCFATLQRITQTPPFADPQSVAHVFKTGDSYRSGQILIEVIASDATSFTVRVTDDRSGVRFVDDDGNFHEPNIESIAFAGVTDGCNPPLGDRYCPDRAVSRGEMAALLVRALGEEGNIPPYQGFFSDVPASAWYSGAVERLFQLGITTGLPGGIYGPEQPVLRLEMAAFIVRAFGHTSELQPPVGLFFDVPIGAWYADEAELLLALGISSGCATEPLRYCPDDPVLRDQMASFLARAMGLSAA